MKTLLSALLALLAFVNLAKADQILIYQGGQTDVLNARVADREDRFWLFDMTTREVQYVAYGIGASDKNYSVSSTTSLTYQPIATEKNATQTYFEYGSNGMSASFNLQFGYFVGYNVKLVLGGNFTGQFPARIAYTTYGIVGTGTTSTDTVSAAKSTYALNLTLTQQSNTGNDDLSAAVSILTTLLSSHGYTPLPP